MRFPPAEEGGGPQPQAHGGEMGPAALTGAAPGALSPTHNGRGGDLRPFVMLLRKALGVKEICHVRLHA
jgi:hypothetical protein